jgi:UDP-glucose 4-epimerase
LVTDGTTRTTALVTGGAGFMGSHVVDAILQQPELAVDRIVVLDDLSGGSQDNLTNDSRVEFVRGSITDVALVDRLFKSHRFQYVYHLAAYAAEGLSHFIRRFNYTNNLIGSTNLINAAVRFKAECFVFTSSIAAYGEGRSPLSEDLSPRPVDPYGIAKYAVELDLAAAHELFGLKYVIFRPHNVYGERQHLGDRYRNVVGIFMNRLLSGQPMPIFGDGTQERAFTYIADVAPVIAGSPQIEAAQNQVFNLGSDDAYAVNELAMRVAKALGVAADVHHLEARHEVHVAYCDHSKIQRIFPDLQHTSLDEGLRRMAAWARRTTIREGQQFDPLELEKNLPASWRDSGSAT